MHRPGPVPSDGRPAAGPRGGPRERPRSRATKSSRVGVNTSDQDAFLQRDHAVLHPGGNKEGAVRPQHLRLPADADLERPGSHIRHLPVRVVMQRRHCSPAELHAHQHQIRPVAQDLPAHPVRHRLSHRLRAPHEGSALHRSAPVPVEAVSTGPLRATAGSLILFVLRTKMAPIYRPRGLPAPTPPALPGQDPRWLRQNLSGR